MRVRVCAVGGLPLAHEHVHSIRSAKRGAPPHRRIAVAHASALLVLVLGGCRPPVPAVQPSVAPTGIAADLAYLASRPLGGRVAGTPGNDSAAVFLARRHEALGIPGAFPSQCTDQQRCPWSYFQYFKDHEVSGHNVGAFIRGSHPTLFKEFIVVGAHYDHIGTFVRFSLDPDMVNSLRLGADDNASGTAAVLELARRLAANPPLRSVLLVHFDAEEWGLVGSRAFVQQPPIAGIPLRRTFATAGRSDHAAFASIGVPALSLTSGFHGDYHRVTDVASRIDLAGLARVVDLAEAIVRASASREWPARTTSSMPTPPK